MPLKLGDQDLTTVYLGTINIARMYLGAIQVLSTRQTFVQSTEIRGYFTDNANTLVLPHNVVAFVSMQGFRGEAASHIPSTGPNGQTIHDTGPNNGVSIWGVLNTGETTRTLTFAWAPGEVGIPQSSAGIGGRGFRISEGSTILYNAPGGTGQGWRYRTNQDEPYDTVYYGGAGGFVADGTITTNDLGTQYPDYASTPLPSSKPSDAAYILIT